MSDGHTEAMKGFYDSNKNPIPIYDPQTGELNPYYKELTGKENPLDIKHMPNQKLHKVASFIKSGIRILGYGALWWSLDIGVILLILSEIVGIGEELV